MKPGLWFLGITVLLSAWLFSGDIPVPAAPDDNSNPVVVLQTNQGPITISVYLSLVPHTAGRFLDLVSQGFYNGLTFHRVENWVVQGGDPQGNGTGVYVDPGTGQPAYLQLETNRLLRHDAPGVVAMAHSKSINSSSCQFYITKKAVPALNGGYSIFGKVIDGMNIVYGLHPGDEIISARIINDNAKPTNHQAAGDSGF